MRRRGAFWARWARRSFYGRKLSHEQTRVGLCEQPSSHFQWCIVVSGTCGRFCTRATRTHTRAHTLMYIVTHTHTSHAYTQGIHTQLIHTRTNENTQHTPNSCIYAHTYTHNPCMHAHTHNSHTHTTRTHAHARTHTRAHKLFDNHTNPQTRQPRGAFSLKCTNAPKNLLHHGSGRTQPESIFGSNFTILMKRFLFFHHCEIPSWGGGGGSRRGGL